MITTINKSARVKQKMTTAIYHTLTISFSDRVFKTAIFKNDISDHFPIFFMIPSSTKHTNTIKNIVIFKRVLHTESIELLKQKLYEANWDDIEAS